MRVAAARRALTFSLVAVLSVAAADAEDDRKTEIGVGLLGAQMTTTGRGDVFTIGSPGGKSAYATLFLSSRLAFEPQLAVAFVSTRGDSIHIVRAAGQIDVLIGDRNESAPFVFGRGIFERTGGDGGGNNDSGAGGGLGYRILMGDRGVLRFEGGFDHMFEGNGRSSRNTFAAAMVLGLRL